MSGAWLVVAAAGSGERLQAETPKAFVLLGGRPLVAYGLEAAARSGVIEAVVLVCDPEPGKRVLERLSSRARDLVRSIVPGGATRRQSVNAGLRQVAESCRAPGAGAAPAADSDPVVLVHDAARPFAPPELFARVAERAATAAVTCAQPPADTVKELRGDLVARTLSREMLALVQTPQGARLSVLLRAHESGGDDAASDDALLIERLGVPVAVVAGSAHNFKVTTREDLALAEAWARAGGAAWMPPEA